MPNLIQWMPGKTNDEYMAELQQHPTQPRLQELRYYFDYAWYGHFEINDRLLTASIRPSASLTTV